MRNIHEVNQQASPQAREGIATPGELNPWLTATLLVTLCLYALWALASSAQSAQVEAPTTDDIRLAKELTGRYDRGKSQVMARVVERPTRARLDYATHDRNVLMHVPKPELPKAPARKPKLADLTFEDALVAGSLKDKLVELPLTESEKDSSLALEPLLEYLANWDFDASEELLLCAAMVSEENWGNDQIARPLQKMALLYLHQGKGGPELWAKVEFEPTVTFIEGVTDEDRDGYREIYGRVKPKAVNAALVKQIRTDYMGQVLGPEQVEDYFYELASAWYEKLQTISLKPNQRTPWPNEDTEPAITKAMAGRAFQRPTAVIRGKPFGEPLYNVFLVSWSGGNESAERGQTHRRRSPVRVVHALQALKAPDHTSLVAKRHLGLRRQAGMNCAVGAGRAHTLLLVWRRPDVPLAKKPLATFAPDGSVSQVLAAVQTYGDGSAANIARWQRELEDWGGGSWEGWAKKLAPFRADVRKQLDSRPAALKSVIGNDGFLFFRGSLEYVLAGDLRKQTNGRDPFPAIVDYHKQLKAKGIDMLLVVIPAKPEVYPEKISTSAPSGKQPRVAPYTRKLLLELAEAGVESVDLLPAFLDARDKHDEPFYMTQDTHWSNAAARLAAKLIGHRVKQYAWYDDVCPKPLAYKTRNATSSRTGDIRGMLKDSEKLRCRPMKLKAQQVICPDGKLYEDSPDSPVVMLGDSFCGVFHFEDCKHAGVSAHLAKEIGMPVDLIMAHGSGPMIRGQLARKGAAYVAKKRLVIWTVVARDLYNYRAPWKKIPVP